MQHKIRNSIIQLVLGIILVGLASWYLAGHPAEWQSIKSSVSTAKQKISKLIGSAEGIKGMNVVSSQKEQATKSLTEIIAAVKSCDPTASVAETQALYDTVSKASLEDFARNGAIYYSQMNVAYQNMQELCNKIPKSLDQ